MNTKQHRAWMEKADRLSKAIQLSFPSADGATYRQLLAEHLRLVLRPFDVQDTLESEDDDVRVRDDFIKREGYVPFPWNAPGAGFGGSRFSPPGFRPAGGEQWKTWNGHWMQAPAGYGTPGTDFTQPTESRYYGRDHATGQLRYYLEAGHGQLHTGSSTIRTGDHMLVYKDHDGRLFAHPQFNSQYRHTQSLTFVCYAIYRGNQIVSGGGLTPPSLSMLVCRDTQSTDSPGGGQFSVFLTADIQSDVLARVMPAPTLNDRLMVTTASPQWLCTARDQGLPQTYTEVLSATHVGRPMAGSDMRLQLRVLLSDGDALVTVLEADAKVDGDRSVVRAVHEGDTALVIPNCHVILCVDHQGNYATFTEGDITSGRLTPYGEEGKWQLPAHEIGTTWKIQHANSREPITFTLCMIATYAGQDIVTGGFLPLNVYRNDEVGYTAVHARTDNWNGANPNLVGRADHPGVAQPVRTRLRAGDEVLICRNMLGVNVAFTAADVKLGWLVLDTPEQKKEA